MPDADVLRHGLGAWEQGGIFAAGALFIAVLAWGLWLKVIAPAMTKTAEIAKEKALAEASRAQAALAVAGMTTTLANCLEESNEIAQRLERMHEQNFKRLEKT